jgi:hypothetical protein
VGFGVIRLTSPTISDEEPPDAAVSLWTTMVHDVHRPDIAAFDMDADLLRRFPDHSGNHVLVSFELPGREIEPAIRVTSATALGKEHVAVAFQDQHHVHNDGVRHKESFMVAIGK